MIVDAVPLLLGDSIPERRLGWAAGERLGRQPGRHQQQQQWGCSPGSAARLHAALLCSVVSGVLWWLYYDYRNDPSTELETEKENVKFLLGYAVFSTIVTVSSALPSATAQAVT